MVPGGPPNPLGGAQPVPSSLLRSNSGLMGGQGSGMPSQGGGFPSIVSPRTQFGNMNMLGNAPNVSSLLHQSLGNGGHNPGLPGPGMSQRVDNGAESDPLSSAGNGMGFNTPSTSFVSSAMTGNPNSGQVQGQRFPSPSGNQMLTDQSPSQQLDTQNYQQHNQQFQQFSAPSNSQTQQQQQQFQSMRGGLGGVGPVKQEPQASNDQAPQQLQALRNLASVKQEPQQQIQSIRGLTTVKQEPQHSSPSLFLHQQQQQQQQQQLLHMSKQSPQAAAAAQLFHQQRLMQLQQQQQQQQQQLLKGLPQQRNPLQQQFQTQNHAIRSPVKPAYEPGMCARRLTHYLYQQQHRPEDNNIEFWRKFVVEYFAPSAKKKWCVSMYGSGRQTTGVFPQDVWHCEICNRKPGRGFEATAEVLPRLFKIKYESGTLEELLYVDMPREYQNSSGQIVLDYAKAIQESVFEQLRVVRDGQLRIVFSQPDLKIVSWEFCARRHEELIPRRLLIPQVSQLGAAAQKYQATTQNGTTASVSELQNNCNMFVASARQLAKALEVPLVNDLGYTKRYVRCLQISEVVNSMKDLIDYSRETRTGPMESLAKFPRRNGSSAGVHGAAQPSEDQSQQQQTQSQSQQQQTQSQSQQQQQQQTASQNSNHESSVQAGAMQLASSNGIPSVNNSLNQSSVTSSNSTVVRLLHQNSMNSRQQPPMNGVSSPYAGNGVNSPYGGSSVQMPSPSSSNTMPPSQPNSSTFQSPTPCSSSNPPQTSHGGLSSGSHMNSANSPNISMHQPALSGDVDANDSQSSVQKIIHEMMMSSQLGGGGLGGGGTMGNDMKSVNGMMATANNSILNGSSCLVGNGTANANIGMGPGYGNMGNGLSQAAMVRAALGNNSMSMNGRVGMPMSREQSMNQQQQDLGNQLLSGLGAVNGFNNLQFDWKTSP
ncbi:transcriptional corepressor SEUSS-like [Lycium ferocissimum]|uniref:transcriptional corepressor SEUSS-like n=1 Tax=Lycium ferocissimum TaxID=112874 RepID=UPI002814B33F|nr:transcriptional corepressor SEUSS-like [Lycium ferocissimum]XP_059280174.1 transcriptional corepressor SEUSS-like [Lycium ferocissimum]XP_059280175.1 transcriptional corepressor SEUSS-like [Lycium ferocissimum]